jgi:hypothetical protein
VLGEHLGQLLAIAWSITVSVLVLRSGMLPRWAGWTGLIASLLYLTSHGDILATAIPGFPVWDLGGLLGSTLWVCGCSPWAWPCCEVRSAAVGDPVTATAPATP